VSDVERRAFACPPASGHVDGIDLALLDPADEDDRKLLIEADHPELLAALLDETSEVHAGAHAMNPRLHIAIHEIVANQLWSDNPPEMWQTAERLIASGYGRHEVLHMLGSVVSGEVRDILAAGAHHDIERVRQALAALPESWEARRHESVAEHNRDASRRRPTGRPGHRGHQGSQGHRGH
jgi:DNA-binding GntR family transcriptional regulator